VAVYRAAGRNVPAMILETVRLWGMRIPFAFLLAYPLGLGATGAWWGMALSNVLAGLLAILFLRRRTWQHAIVEPASDTTTPHPGGTRAVPDEP
jgi:Na+-driven multidrug efflux pump